LHTMIGLTGQLGASVALDAFVTTMCKASLPSSYARSLFSAPSKGPSANTTAASPVLEEVFERSPVVIVVTQGAGHSITITPTTVSSTGTTNHPVSGSTSSANVASHGASTGTSSGHDLTHNYPTGSLLITAKHLQSAKAVLLAAQAHGNVLSHSWNVVLTTLQNLVWMLGLKVEPAAELYFKPIPNASGSGQNSDGTVPGSGGATGLSVIASAVSGVNANQPRTSLLSSSSTVSSDLATLSNMLSLLFTQSR
uniref:Protein MON2 homolog n=1 Tax=Echinostoma caproni TaxID=27848 RepID=A0A183BAF6_9TREM